MGQKKGELKRRQCYRGVYTHTSGMVKGRVVQRPIHGGHVALAVPLRHGALEQLVRGANHAQGLRHIFREADRQSQIFLLNVSIKTGTKVIWKLPVDA